jgi:hypothetical protein
MKRSSIQVNVSNQVLKEWASSIKLILRLLIFSTKTRHKMLCLLYHYRHLNEKNLTNLSSTDLYTHRVRIKSDVKLVSKVVQKRWSAHTKWWLRKIITDDMKREVYELTKSANDRLSQWNARVVIVEKMKNSTSENKSRVTFDYFRMIEELSETFMKLSSKVHDNLSDSRHQCLFKANLKHAYLIISMHSSSQRLIRFSSFVCSRSRNSSISSWLRLYIEHLASYSRQSRSLHYFISEIFWSYQFWSSIQCLAKGYAFLVFGASENFKKNR